MSRILSTSPIACFSRLTSKCRPFKFAAFQVLCLRASVVAEGQKATGPRTSPHAREWGCLRFLSALSSGVYWKGVLWRAQQLRS